MRITLSTLHKMTQDGDKITMLTCYDASFAALLETAGFKVRCYGSAKHFLDDGEVRQASAERLHRGGAVAVGADGVSLARERGGVVVPDGRFVFDDGDELLHGLQGYRLVPLT